MIVAFILIIYCHVLYQPFNYILLKEELIVLGWIMYICVYETVCVSIVICKKKPMTVSMCLHSSTTNLFRGTFDKYHEISNLNL